MKQFLNQLTVNQTVLVFRDPSQGLGFVVDDCCAVVKKLRRDGDTVKLVLERNDGWMFALNFPAAARQGVTLEKAV